jgi:hypothetical protein
MRIFPPDGPRLCLDDTRGFHAVEWGAMAATCFYSFRTGDLPAPPERFAAGGPAGPPRLALPPYCQKRLLSRVGSLVLRFARAGHHTTSPPRDMTGRPARARDVQALAESNFHSIR